MAAVWRSCSHWKPDEIPGDIKLLIDDIHMVKRIKQASRKIYLYKRADMVGPKDHMVQFKGAYLSEDHSHMPVNDM